MYISKAISPKVASTVVLVTGEGDAGGDLVTCPGTTPVVLLLSSEPYTDGDLVQVTLVMVAFEGDARGVVILSR